jgi:hypothetical protein
VQIGWARFALFIKRWKRYLNGLVMSKNTYKMELKIDFQKSKSFVIYYQNQVFDSWEVEELSLTFVQKLAENQAAFLKNSTPLSEIVFSFEIPFDMISLIFQHTNDGFIILSSKNYDDSDLQEWKLPQDKFYTALTIGLTKFYSSISEEYIVDSSFGRHKKGAWNENLLKIISSFTDFYF